MHEFDQIKSIIGTIEIILNAMKSKKVGIEEIQDVQLTAAEINRILYHAPKLKFQKEYDLNNEREYYAFVGEIEALESLWKESIDHRNGKRVDKIFWEIYECFKYVEPKEIYDMTVENFKNLPEWLRIEFLSLPHRYSFLKNKLDYTKNDFSLLWEHVNMMADEVDRYKWLYEHLADYRSKKVLNGIIQYWFTFNINELHALCETVYSDYYDLDILECNEEDVMVDLGAYVGDSVIDFINTYGAYKKIYAYEITPGTCQKLENNVSAYSNVTVMHKGVGSQAGIMYVNGVDCGAGNHLSDSGDTEVEVVTLDEDIKEPITVIKMDIEGAEKDALIGASRHIAEDKPKLLISSYHLAGDIFDVPYLINDIRDDYKFYMRFNGHNGLWPCDYVLFAV